MGALRRLLDRLDGPPLSLPAVPDRLAERWWALSPRVRLALGVCAAVLVVAVAGLGAARSPWGAAATVRVAARDLPAGHVVAPGDLAGRRWPAGLAPDLAHPVGRRLAMSVPAGAALRAGHLDPGGPAAGLEPGMVAVPLTREAVAAAGRLTDGHRVDLLAADAAGRGRVLARGARVLASGPELLWVAVDRTRAAAVAGAAARGPVTAALLPTPGRTGPR